MKNASSRNFIRTALLAVLLCALPSLAGDDIFGIGTGRTVALTHRVEQRRHQPARDLAHIGGRRCHRHLHHRGHRSPAPAWSIAPTIW